ncbi:MAG: ABC transporter substrate-binding protein [Prevotella sp.]|nr:ABC transporter substrate-binding protein [Prevotella sp.]
MRNIIGIVFSLLLVVACGQSYEEQQRLSREDQKRLAREDSSALKIAVMPTLDCLPMYVARHYGLYERLGADIRLKHFVAQMDCDKALGKRKVEGMITDIVRGRRIEERGIPLKYVAATGAYWQLITNKSARIKTLKQLDDKMTAMARFSATDLLSDYVRDSVKLGEERTFKVQINDVNIRFKMLENNMMDAAWLPEPQATAARKAKHRVVADSRKLGMRFGAVAFREELFADTARKRQIDVFVKAYDMACDSINKNGIKAYAEIVKDYCSVTADVVNAIPKDIKFTHAAAPCDRDMDKADNWLKANGKENGKE